MLVPIPALPVLPLLPLLLLLPGTPPAGASQNSHQHPHERLLLLQHLNFCDPDAYPTACRHGRFKDLYCSPQLAATRELLTSYCRKHQAWAQQQQQQQGQGEAGAGNDGYRYAFYSVVTPGLGDPGNVEGGHFNCRLNSNILFLGPPILQLTYKVVRD